MLDIQGPLSPEGTVEHISFAISQGNIPGPLSPAGAGDYAEFARSHRIHGVPKIKTPLSCIGILGHWAYVLSHRKGRVMGEVPDIRGPSLSKDAKRRRREGEERKRARCG